MLKIILYSVGKNKEAWLNDALSFYQNRLKNQIKLEMQFVKNSDALIKALSFEKVVVSFDPKGQEMNSKEFSDCLQSKLVEGGSKLALVIGEGQGLPKELKQGYTISFSKMIFTHQLSRLIVVEQIYRAVQIWNNSPYHFS